MARIVYLLAISTLLAAPISGQLLAPSPAAGFAPAPAVGPYGHSNTTGTSLFVIEALLATFVRSAADSCTGTLRLESVSPAATWFSETPKRISGRISSSEFASPNFYATTGDPASWLNNANMAMFSSKNNASTSETTFVFATNGAPQVSGQGSTWTLNVTLIPSNTKSIYSVGGSSFEAHGMETCSTLPMVTTFAPVALFIDAICYVYNRWTGYIYYWWYC